MDGGPGPSSSSAAILQRKFSQRVQVLLDKSSPHITGRWVVLALTLLAYILRVWFLRGFYIITYGLGIYNLNLALGFLTPQFDPESEGPTLPMNSEQEFKPFVRRLPEFKFWYSSFKSIVVGFTMTFFSMFDVPVFWPILLLYWCILFFVTMKRQIMHMIKHKYLPFTTGKKKYTGNGKAAAPAPKDNK